MKKILSALFFISTIFILSQNYSSSSIPDELKKNANAVIRNEDTEITIKSIDNMEIKKSNVVTILNKGGDGFGTISMSYNPTTKVSNIKVSVLDRDGKEIKTYTKKDFTDISYPEASTIYTDERLLFFRPTPLDYPYTVSYSYTSNTSDTAFLPSYMPFRNDNISVEKSSLYIFNNSGINMRSKIRNTDWASVKANESANSYNYTYENVPALPDEDRAPSMDYILPNVDFSLDQFTLKGKQGEMNTWDNFGKFMYADLLTPVSTITPEISTIINSLNLKGTTAEKVEILYQYMQKNTRYVNLIMGIGGWKPMVADDVRKHGYGDCKALSNYMRTLLNAAGIKSYFSLIMDDQSVERFDKEFPRIYGNHAILMVPTKEGTIWLENTSQKIAFNHLSYTSLDRNVIAIKEDGAELVDTPSYKPTDSKEKLIANVKINPDNSIDAEGNFAFTGGQYDKNMILLSFNNEDLKTAIKSLHNTLKIDQIAINNLNNDRDKANISYELKLKAIDFSKKLGNDIFFRVMPFYNSLTLSNNDERVLPFETAFPFQDDYEVDFTIPQGYKFSEIPKSSAIDSEFGSYIINFSVKDNKLFVHRILTINKGVYPKEKYTKYVEFRKKTAFYDNTKILITKL